MPALATPPVDNDLYNRRADAWWSEQSELYLLKAIVNPWRVPYFRRLLAQEQVDPRGKWALDVGCGGGFLAEEVAALGFAVTGVDPSAQSLAIARAHAAQSALPITYCRGSGERLPFADASFAVVSCGDVLEHIPNWDAVIGEVRRVLARGGIFFYDTINRTLFSKLVLIKLAQDWPWTRVLPPRLHAWEMFITPAELRAALARHGLEHRAVVGGAPPLGNPLRALRLLRQYKAGALSAAAFGRRMALRESRMLAGSYMGYAVKP
jgi:2-polyprenyl-6-hydroxyphenyl methylase/3-demethylubiquinone-9 3-methyltransferase